MGNVRGNTYSSKHATLPPEDLSYNDYTWHEMGLYDLPAMIDHILKATNQPQLFYIGHSMGTSIFFVMASTRPEYNQKIRLMAAMAPAVFLKKSITSFLILAPFAHELVRASKESRLSALTFRNVAPIAKLLTAICADGVPLQNTCIWAYSTVFGFHDKELNTTLLPTILSHGVSWYNFQLIDHFGQISKTGRFQTYGLSIRNSSLPKDYDLSKVTAPVSLHYALNDFATPPVGVLQLSRRLPNVVNLALVSDDQANHNVFIFAFHGRELVYNDLLALMKKY